MTEKQYHENLDNLVRDIRRLACTLYTDGHNKHFDSVAEVADVIMDDIATNIKLSKDK